MAEALGEGSPALRASQVMLEGLGSGADVLRASQVMTEALADTVLDLQLTSSQVMLEVLTDLPPESATPGQLLLLGVGS